MSKEEVVTEEELEQGETTGEEETVDQKQALLDSFKELQGNQFDEPEKAKEEEVTEEEEEGTEESSKKEDDEEEIDSGTTAKLTEKEKGLIKELKEERKKRQEAESGNEEVKKLRQELEELKSKQKVDPNDPWSKVTNEQIRVATIQTEEKYRQAVRDGDDAEAQKQGQFLQQLLAKADERSKPKQQEEVNTEAQALAVRDLQKIDDIAKKAIPDFYKEDTEANDLLLLKAKEFPALEHFGELGNMLLGAMVIIEHPELVSGKVTRKVTKKLEDQINKSLKKAGSTGSTPTKRTTRTHKENIELAEAIKAGTATL